MAENRPTIPENQLLDLIKNPQKAQQVSQRRAVEQSVRSFFSLSALKGRMAFFWSRLRSRGKGSPADFGFISKLLNIAIIILLTAFIVYLFFAVPRSTRVPDFKAPSQKVNADHAGTDDMFDTQMSEYLDKPHMRNIFKFGEFNNAPPAEEVQAPQEEAVEESADELQDLELVGIAFSDDPDVMIRDTTTEEVYFVKRGDWIREEIKVEAIYPDSVLLTHKGKEIELR